MSLRFQIVLLFAATLVVTMGVAAYLGQRIAAQALETTIRERAVTVTRQALEGMNQGQTDVMRFTATPAGSYRIFCGVPGHGLSGMWIWFKVDAAATAASQAITAK